MLVRAEFTEVPKKILVEEHDGTNYIWLRKNIKEVEKEESTVYTADEAYFEANLTEEDIDSKFDAYFTYGAAWVKEANTLSLEERVSALEDMMLVLL